MMELSLLVGAVVLAAVLTLYLLLGALAAVL